MLTQLKDKLVADWRKSGEIQERELLAAKSLPWKAIGEVASVIMVWGCGFVGAVMGFVLGFVLGAIGGALLGMLIGFILRGVAGACLLALVLFIPMPFAWLARRLGYA